MITVKVANFPGTVTEVVVEDGATVSNAFTAAGISPTGSIYSVNGNEAGPDTVLSDGDRVVSAKGAKGN